MDNASFHRKKQLFKIADKYGVLFLPPYNTDYDLIEKSWANFYAGRFWCGCYEMASEQSRTWNRRGCISRLPRNSHAQYALAKMIIETGDTEKIAKAVSWLEKSADSGNQFAQYSLGKLYCSREHMEKDIPKAIKLLSFTTIQTGHNMI